MNSISQGSDHRDRLGVQSLAALTHFHEGVAGLNGYWNLPVISTSFNQNSLSELPLPAQGAINASFLGKSLKKLLALCAVALALMAVSYSAQAALFCVDSAKTLRNALKTSESNAQENEVRITQGTYIGSFNFILP